jgi:hypothetical protein
MLGASLFHVLYHGNRAALGVLRYNVGKYWGYHLYFYFLEKVIVFLIALVASVVILPEKQALVLEPQEIWREKSLHKLE